MKKSILLSVFTLLILNSCCQKEVQTGCPNLQTYDVNVTEDKPFSVTYEVING